MRFLVPLFCLALSIAAAPPATAKDQRTTFRLRHVTATDAERMLVGEPPGVRSAGSQLGSGGELGAAQKWLLPAGVRSLVADPLANTLSVTGEAAAIRTVGNLVRLLDIPPRRVQLTATVLQLAPAVVQELGLGAVVTELAIGRSTGVARPILVTSVREAEQLAKKAAATLVEAQVATLNNRTAYVQWPAPPGGAEKLAGTTAIMPRVNGDETVTLFLSLGPAQAGTGESGQAAYAIRRVKSGTTVIVDLQDGLVLLVTPQVLTKAVERSRRR